MNNLNQSDCPVCSGDMVYVGVEAEDRVRAIFRRCATKQVGIDHGFH